MFVNYNNKKKSIRGKKFKYSLRGSFIYVLCRRDIGDIDININFIYKVIFEYKILCYGILW